MAKSSRLTANFETNVFINCPFDDEYQPLFYAIVFAVNDLGFNAKCAKDESNAGKSRIEKIQDLIAECKFSIHDISRVELDPVNNLPRFNMPFELGLDLGCKQYGKTYQRNKVVLVLETEQYRYQKYISDLAGCDPVAHHNSEEEVIDHVRNWLRLELEPKLAATPSGSLIYQRYQQFQIDLPSLCAMVNWNVNKLPFSDFSWSVADWITRNPISSMSIDSK
jgi:hypothetical protein